MPYRGQSVVRRTGECYQVDFRLWLRTDDIASLSDGELEQYAPSIRCHGLTGHISR